MTQASKRPRQQAPSTATAATAATATDASIAEEKEEKKRKKGAPLEALKKPTYAEAKQAREEAAKLARDLTRERMNDVLLEIQGHMEEILVRIGPDAVAKWKAALASGAITSEADRRDVFGRLVHAVQEPNVQVPEELRADLFVHQVEGLEWLASLYANGLHGILADEMGLGKTIQTISLLMFVKERKGNVGPHLIVAPKSTLSNWQTEFERFAPSFGVHVLTGDEEKREAQLSRLRADVAAGRPTACVTNYEQVHRNEWLSKNKWQLIVVDEGHRLKNPETVLHNAMVQLRCRMRLLLTGTPLQNSLNELWALLHYLLPDLFTVLMDFKAWFAQPFKGVEGLNEFDVQLDPEQEQQVIARMHALLSPFLLQRLKSEVLADRLPPRVEATIRVPLSAWQAATYQDLERKTIRLLGQSDTVTSEQVNNAFMQLRKIVLHPYLFQAEYARDADLYRASGKVEALDRLLSKLLRFSHKVLIFSQFTTVLDILEEFLAFRQIGHVRLDGQVPHEQRARRIATFNTDPKTQVFLLSARAGGLGLNLQVADTVVLFDLDWNPQNDRQAVARVHRVGQTREVRVVRLVTDTPVERHIEKVCEEKLEIEKKIMGAGMFRRQATAEERRKALWEVIGLQAEAEASATSGSGTGSSKAAGGAASKTKAEASGARGTASTSLRREEDLTTLEEQNRSLARNDEELQAFTEMDEASLRPGTGSRGSRAARASDPDTPPWLDRLLQCNRLMRTDEVPKGFSLGKINED
jgi:SNF2 family DNA or RNA helicase